MDGAIHPNHSMGVLPEPWNNPHLTGLLDGETRGTGDFTKVDDQTAYAPGTDNYERVAPLGPHNELMRLRAEFPFLPILPLSPSVKTLFLTANVAQNIDIPDQVKTMFIRAALPGAGTAPFFISVRGNAAVPSAADSGTRTGDNANSSFIPPTDMLLYIGNIRQISVIAPTTGTIVTVLFYVPTEYARYT